MIILSSATVVLSSDHAGARPVAVSMKLRYEMQCGWPGPGTLTVSFPPAMAVPPAIPPGAVRIDGRPAASAVTEGHSEVIGLPKRPLVMCDSIGPGLVTVSFTRAANLGNPKAKGSYVLRATRPMGSFAARFTVS